MGFRSAWWASCDVVTMNTARLKISEGQWIQSMRKDKRKRKKILNLSAITQHIIDGRDRKNTWVEKVVVSKYGGQERNEMREQLKKKHDRILMLFFFEIDICFKFFFFYFSKLQGGCINYIERPNTTVASGSLSCSVLRGRYVPVSEYERVYG